MTDRELIEQALDALNGLLGWQSLAPHDDQENAKAVSFQISARLAQCDRCGKVNPAEIHTCTPRDSRCAECGKKASDGYALYCVKCSEPLREWVGLTEKDIVDCFDLMPPKFARAIEAKLKEKNALPSS